MVGRSHVLFAVLGLALVGCSNSDDASDTSGQSALNGSESDKAQAEEDRAPKHKPLLVLCRPPQRLGGAPQGPAPFVPDVNRLPEGAPQEGGPGAPQEGGPHEGGPRPLPCVAPAKKLPLLCAPAPFWREVLSKIGGHEGPGAPGGAPRPPMGAPEEAAPGGPDHGGPEGGERPHHPPPILCIVAPPRHGEEGPFASREGGPGGPGFGDGDAPSDEMPKPDLAQLGGKPPAIFACRPKKEMGGRGDGPGAGAPPDAPAMTGGPGGAAPGAPGAHPPALALACILMGPPPGGPEGGEGGAPPPPR